jgi:acetyltransferase-like isoleucine patch superfamily enzyme
MVRDNDGHAIATDGKELQEMEPKDINIGNHCWFGQRSMVLKDVKIEDNVVVAAGAVVAKSVKSGSVVAGVPAKAIKEGVNWKA